MTLTVAAAVVVGGHSVSFTRYARRLISPVTRGRRGGRGPSSSGLRDPRQAQDTIRPPAHLFKFVREEGSALRLRLPRWQLPFFRRMELRFFGLVCRPPLPGPSNHAAVSNSSRTSTSGAAAELCARPDGGGLRRLDAGAGAVVSSSSRTFMPSQCHECC